MAESRRPLLLACGLAAFGVARVVADLAGASSFAGGLGATCAAPAPKVFSSVRGLETFSTGFRVAWRRADGRTGSLDVTPAEAGRLAGPYPRRNVYGAVLAYGPVLLADPRTEPLFRSVAERALCGDAPVLGELTGESFATAPVVSAELVWTPREGVPAPALPLRATIERSLPAETPR